MHIERRIDIEKALEVLLYVTKRVRNIYNALKVLYFADKMHLGRYGRLIYGDSYVAMAHGPVPSAAYDLVKDARGEGVFQMPVETRQSLTVEANQIIPGREAKLDLLSESEIECLDEAIAQYGELPFGALKKASHEDKAFQSADDNDFMSLEAIAESLPDSDLLLDYLRSG